MIWGRRRLVARKTAGPLHQASCLRGRGGSNVGGAGFPVAALLLSMRVGGLASRGAGLSAASPSWFEGKGDWNDADGDTGDCAPFRVVSAGFHRGR